MDAQGTVKKISEKLLSEKIISVSIVAVVLLQSRAPDNPDFGHGERRIR